MGLLFLSHMVIRKNKKKRSGGFSHDHVSHIPHATLIPLCKIHTKIHSKDLSNPLPTVHSSHNRQNPSPTAHILSISADIIHSKFHYKLPHSESLYPHLTHAHSPNHSLSLRNRKSLTKPSPLSVDENQQNRLTITTYRRATVNLLQPKPSPQNLRLHRPPNPLHQPYSPHPPPTTTRDLHSHHPPSPLKSEPHSIIFLASPPSNPSSFTSQTTLAAQTFINLTRHTTFIDQPSHPFDKTHSS